MKWIYTLALAGAILWCSAAQAGQQAMVPCPKLEDGCVLTCVQLDLITSSFRSDAAPLQIELLDVDGSVLATATLAALSAGQTRANFDTRVTSNDVDSIRLYTPDETGRDIGWAELKVLCDPCACGCWNDVFKGCLCDWRPTAEQVLVVEPEPEPVVERPRLKRNPPKREVVQVPGRG